MTLHSPPVSKQMPRHSLLELSSHNYRKANGTPLPTDLENLLRRNHATVPVILSCSRSSTRCAGGATTSNTYKSQLSSSQTTSTFAIGKPNENYQRESCAGSTTSTLSTFPFTIAQVFTTPRTPYRDDQIMSPLNSLSQSCAGSPSL